MKNKEEITPATPEQLDSFAVWVNSLESGFYNVWLKIYQLEEAIQAAPEETDKEALYPVADGLRHQVGMMESDLRSLAREMRPHTSVALSPLMHGLKASDRHGIRRVVEEIMDKPKAAPTSDPQMMEAVSTLYHLCLEHQAHQAEQA